MICTYLSIHTIAKFIGQPNFLLDYERSVFFPVELLLDVWKCAFYQGECLPAVFSGIPGVFLVSRLRLSSFSL